MIKLMRLVLNFSSFQVRTYLMEFPLQYLNSPSIILSSSLIIFSLLLWITKAYNKNAAGKRGAPEATGAWPLVGHLPLLGGSLPPHITLGNMADKYGPIFTIKLGVHRSLIVSSWDIAKECLTINDRVFANRPKLLASEVMGYNYAMFGFSPYGPYWRQMRKVATMELLSNHRLESLKHVRESEVKACTKNIYDLWKQNKSTDVHLLVDMTRWFEDVTLSTMFRMVVGKRFLHDNEENERYRKASTEFSKLAGEFSKLAGEFVMADAVPFLRWLDLGGHEKAMKKTAKELDHVLERWLEEHKLKRSSFNSNSPPREPQDFMDMLLSVLDDSILEFRGKTTADTINKATCMALILAGTDTTTVTLIWALSLLVNNPASLNKAQNELNIQIGRNRQVNESDMKNLVYLQAIIKETLRLYPAGPLSLPHESTEACTVGNYHVPAKTRLIVNLWKLHRDPNVWQDPCVFLPERFLTSNEDFDVRGQNFELIPFGSGRRMCPGISLALRVIELTLAHLLHGFEITAPSDEPVDMSETVGLTNMKATPLQVLLKPRLPADMYQHLSL